MKRNIKIAIEYDGTNYHGWQLQKDLPTVQGELQNSIEKLTAEKVIVYGSGRTDSGVHARGQIANFFTASTIPEASFAKALNSHLPVDIVVLESHEENCEFHAQFKAKVKAYSYEIVYRPVRPALDYRYAHWIWFPLDLELMREASDYLIGTHDFSSFEAANSPRKSSVRTVNYIDIRQQSCYIKILIEANGFLYRMVRNIVGTLIAVGQKRFIPKYVKNIVQAKDRKLGGASVPAKGLFLEYVKY